MLSVARRQKHCQILCFTIKYEIVNKVLQSGETVPENLHLLFSAWKGLDIDNPYRLPEAHVRYRDGSTTASADAKKCSGNCTECALTNGGCWNLMKGQQVVFDEH